MINRTASESMTQPQEANHSACGVGMIVSVSRENHALESHQLVLDGLKTLADFEYRSGYNLATEESDGAGIRFYGLSNAFFTKKIKDGEFNGERLDLLTLKKDQFAIGHYFLPEAPEQLEQAKGLIEANAKACGLKVAGWRNMNAAINKGILSVKANQKMPAIWQSIIISDHANTIPGKLEPIVLKMGLHISAQAREENLALNIVSLSSESIVYKGMLRASELADFYRDLNDKEFTASAVTLHARFATNTDPQWSNAQPCVYFWAHNGELNSAPANAVEMSSELRARGFRGIYPNEKLSDSMQFDADLANQIMMKGIQLDEALMRLMSPESSEEYSAEINAMLKYWHLDRTPYNGPAFAVAGADGYYMAKLDSMGLRPSRWAITEDSDGNQRIYAASDDFLDAEEHHVLQKGHLDPGGMVMITPQGNVLHTEAILHQIAARYHQKDPAYFQHQLHHTLLAAPPASNPDLSVATTVPTGSELQRILYSAGWDYESEDQVVRFMAEHGFEKTGAMGDDTNVLHTGSLPAHISYFFHQLFAQVSAPPLDSIKERKRFSLTTFLGSKPGYSATGKQIELDSPILRVDGLDFIESQPELHSLILDTSFAIPITELAGHEDRTTLMRHAIQELFKKVDQAIAEPQCAVLILSDRNAGPNRALIPDLIAVAAVRRYLESSNSDRKLSLVMDSYQVNGPHQASTLLALGAKAVFPRGAYEKISAIFPENTGHYCKNYQTALQKCLLKTMGKMGITDVNNYINGSLVAALGLDLTPASTALAEHPTLANIFTKIYSPLKGFTLGHIAEALLLRHQQAHNPEHDFVLLPRSGYYMPEKNGVKHGYGPEVVNAFTDWMNQENLQAKLYQLHLILERKGSPDFIKDCSVFSLENGFLDPRQKDLAGFYPPAYLEQFKVSPAFKEFTKKIDRYRREHPTSLHDYFSVKANNNPPHEMKLQSLQEIRGLLFSGSMSQGALTVASPKTPHQPGAHETLTRGMNAVGAKSASGEGGEAPYDLQDPLTTTRSKQFASGRFGISVEQIIHAEEIEIKVAQGAKPGEGGELPGSKVSIRFAAQRGGLPHLNFVSPPPHHDIYSIEDLEQLIHDIKSVNPKTKVAVKLVSSQGIGTIAVGVAKAGADVINIASNSGGTGAAQQSSIKHAGLPAELGLAEVDKALRKTKLRDVVQLRVSGGFKTSEEVIISAILGADLFEFGTTAMITLGCKMQRTCNQSCQPGVATDGHLFKGDQINTERYFVNIAASIQERLKELGYASLRELRGRTELLEMIHPEHLALYDFSALLNRDNLPESLNDNELIALHNKLNKRLVRPKEDLLIPEITNVLATHEAAVFSTEEPIKLTPQDRSFGARIAGSIALQLQKAPMSKTVIHTKGNAGQSYGFVMRAGMTFKHTGTVLDGCAKSMTGGELILCTPEQGTYKANQNTIAGNAMLYGASGGKIYVNGKAGHRFGILLKGAEVVVEGVGDFAFEYMTSGTGLILGHVGKELGTGASGGIIIVYDPDNSLHPTESVRVAATEERSEYAKAIQSMLKEHAEKTNSLIANELLRDFNISQFKVLIPTEMDKIHSLSAVLDVIHTYLLRKAPLTRGMHIWLEQKTLHAAQNTSKNSKEMDELRELLHSNSLSLLSSRTRAKLTQILHRAPTSEQFDLSLARFTAAAPSFWQSPKKQKPVEERLATITGELDDLLLDAIKHIQSYVAELSHDANGCSGCRAQSCSGGEKVDTGCPSGKGINTINSLLKRIGEIKPNGILNKDQWNYLRQAFAIQTQESPFIAYTGAACPAPCQDACTETIPNSGSTLLERRGKLVGEHVHIKDIEYYLYHVGRAMGWFDGKKIWTHNEINTVFGSPEAKADYDAAMHGFKPLFRSPEHTKHKSKELIIVGSGPAAMQIAYRALLDGVTVRMYEKSDKFGGLLADGIPAHKFDKAYLAEDFAYLQAIGLKLHLNSEVLYDKHRGEYCVQGKPIASAFNENQYVALCVGAGQPKTLSPTITGELNSPTREKIIQAADFLKAANDLANELKSNPTLSTEEKEALLKKYFGSMDPRNKKIVIIGGGDTAQDVIRWIARYFNSTEEGSLGELDILVRGPQITKRSIIDSYPNPSRAPNHENELKAAEVSYVQGTERYLVEPVRIVTNSQNTKLNLQIKESKLRYADEIYQDPQLKELVEALPRELRPLDSDKRVLRDIEDVDLIICALGFQGKSSIPLVKAVEEEGLRNVYVAGDAAGTGIIVAAQNNADKIYRQIRALMGIQSTTMSFFDSMTNKPSDKMRAQTSVQDRPPIF